MHRTRLITAAVALATLAMVAPDGAGVVAPGETSTSRAAAVQDGHGEFEIVGHDPLGMRGMNAALAIHDDHAYVGSRTDGKAGNVNQAGIMVVDISDPTDPHVVREIGPPDEGNPGESSRELRVWPSQEILIVLHTNCSALIHYCTQLSPETNFRFYDISGDKAADPELILEFDHNTHEFFLWVDPFDPDFALMFGGSAGNQMQVWDITPVVDGEEPITLYNGPHGYSGGGLHSLSISNDGRFAYFALLTGGFAVADVSDFTARRPDPEVQRVTHIAARPTWPGPGAHSAIKLWGQDRAYVSDEVYGEALRALGHGCPWGWARIIDISDPVVPTVQAEYKLPENEESFCETDVPRASSSYSAHNPTATPNIVFTSWHSGGVQAIDVSDPAEPTQLAELRPDPLPVVLQEDPALSAGRDKVVMWSYPIIQDGLVYIVDLRNGLYVLDYTGPFQEEVDDITFLEGNSNLGDALCFEPVPLPKDSPDDPDEHFVPDHCGSPEG